MHKRAQTIPVDQEWVKETRNAFTFLSFTFIVHVQWTWTSGTWTSAKRCCNKRNVNEEERERERRGTRTKIDVHYSFLFKNSPHLPLWWSPMKVWTLDKWWTPFNCIRFTNVNEQEMWTTKSRNMPIPAVDCHWNIYINYLIKGGGEAVILCLPLS